MRARILATVLATGGCLQGIPLTNPELCAFSEGKVVDPTPLATEGISYGPEGPPPDAFLRCRPPATPQDRCDRDAAQASLAVKLHYNALGPDVFILIAAAFLIVPGVIAYLLYHHERSGIADEAERVGVAVRARCGLSGS